MQRLNTLATTKAWVPLLLVVTLQFAMAIAVSAGWIVNSPAVEAALWLTMALGLLCWAMARWIERAVSRRADELDRSSGRNRRLLALVEDAGPVGVFTYQFGTDVLGWTTGLARIFGRGSQRIETRLDEMLSQFEPDDRQAFEAELQRAIERGQTTLQLAARVRWANGRTRGLLLRMALQYTSGGNATEMLGAAFDATDCHEAEAASEALQESERALHQQAKAERARRVEFMDKLNHELRNPLNVISTGIEVLQRPGLSDKARKNALEVLARQTKRLPVLLSSLNEEAVSTRGAALAGGTPEAGDGSGSGRRVLVVEGDLVAQQALRDVLVLDGHSVTSANDGTVGLQMLVNNRPEVAIIDVGLPGLDGFEVALRARAAGFGGRLIALCEPGITHAAMRALRAGFDAHMAKPVDPLHLRRLMGVACQHVSGGD